MVIAFKNMPLTMFRVTRLYSFSANNYILSYLPHRNPKISYLVQNISRSLCPQHRVFTNCTILRHLSNRTTRKDMKAYTVELQYMLVTKHLDEKVNSSPVVILHGLLGSKDNWQSMARQLNARLGRKVYAVDLRNHGLSPHNEIFSHDAMVRDLMHLLRATERLDKFTLIGHSMGGRVAMMVANQYPEVVQSLIVVDISPVGGSPKMLDIKQLLMDIKNLKLDRYLSLKEARRQTALQLREKKYDEKLIAFILLNLVENEHHTNWQWRFYLDSIIKNYNREIINFQLLSFQPCPTRTLFIGGQESDYLKPEQEEEIKKLFPASEFIYIKGAGHWVHADQPQEFLDTAITFLANDPCKAQQEAEKSPFGEPVELAFQMYDSFTDERKSKAPVIILHGLLGSKQNWNSMAKMINEKSGRVVYAVDARNHGESPHADEFNYHLMMADLLVFLNKHKIDKATIIGHSMGGRVAMLMSMAYPILVHSMIVVDMSPGGPSSNMHGIRTLLNDIKNLKLDPKLTAREARNEAASQLRERVEEEQIIAFIMSNLVEYSCATGSKVGPGGRRWRWKFNLDAIIKHFDSDIVDFPVGKRDCPTRSLFIGGADSDFIRPSDEDEIKKIFPLSEFVYVGGAGHWVHAEKPQQFLDIVAKFLSQDL